MTNKQLHRLKKQWLAEGYYAGLCDVQRNNVQLDEGFKDFLKGAGRYAWKEAIKPGAKLVWKHAKEALKQASIQMLTEILPDLLKEQGTRLANKISTTSKNKAAVSKNAFAQLMYSALSRVPTEEVIHLTIDGVSENLVKSINNKLSEADGYVAPSEEEVENILNAYKFKREQAA